MTNSLRAYNSVWKDPTSIAVAWHVVWEAFGYWNQ